MSDTVKMLLSELVVRLENVIGPDGENMRYKLRKLIRELLPPPLTDKQKLDAIQEANENPKLSMFELQSKIRAILGDKADE